MSALRDMPLQKVGILGDPVAHSLSPAIHNHWCQRYGVNAVYERVPVKAEDFEGVFRALPAQGFVGVNLTIPHKTRVLPLLDGIEDVARQVGAVNTVVFRDGKALGTNTDSEGFAASLQHAGLWKRWKHAVVLGAGGAAQAIVHAIAAQCERMTLCNRSPEKAIAIARNFYPYPIATAAWENRLALLPSCDLLINTTSLGMAHQPALALPLAALQQDATVVDILYAPAQTLLLQEAAAQGHAILNGLGMLLYQAVGGFERWFGIRPEVDDVLWGITT